MQGRCASVLLLLKAANVGLIFARAKGCFVAPKTPHPTDWRTPAKASPIMTEHDVQAVVLLSK
jgi:hypothetical protein